MSNERQTPNFPGMRPPSVPFTEVRDRRRSFPLYFDVDLSVAHSLAAGTAVVQPVAGTFFYIDNDPTNVGNATVRFLDNSSPVETPLAVGPGANFRVPFNGLVIENTAQSGKRLRVIYGVDLDFVPGLNQPLTNGGIAVTITTTQPGAPVGVDKESDNAWACDVLVPAAGAVFGMLQLWNPGASGKRVYVDVARAGRAAANLLYFIRTFNASIGGVLTGAQLPKKSGNPVASVVEIRTGGANPPSGTTVMTFTTPTASQFARWGERDPFILDPGQGMILVDNTQNDAFVGQFEWREY